MRCLTARLGTGLVASTLFIAACGGGSSGDSGSNGDGAVDEFDDDPGAAILDDFGVGDDDSGDDEAVDDQSGATAAGGSGAGAASIVINGISYSYEADICLETGSFLQVSGAGLRADGVPFYGSISVNQDEDVDGDGTPDPSGTVEIEFGTDSPVESGPDDEPSYQATLLIVGDQIDIQDFEYEIDGDGYLTGPGRSTDNNAVETEFGEYVDLIISGGCV